MRPGQRVRVIRGEHEGRIGVVQAVSIDGAAVRLTPRDGEWPFPQVNVIALADLVRAPRLLSRAAIAASMEAPF
jgi:hypothetical protein